jgi:hypothetical protein
MGQRIPYIFGYYGIGVDTHEWHRRSIRRTSIRARYFDSSLMGFAQYPISAPCSAWSSVRA